MPQSESVHTDFYRSSTLGELGCWVDSTVTRIIQTGLEHSRIPDSRSYMQLGICWCLLNQWRTYLKLLSLASAGLSQQAVDYNLSLLFLLRGERGVGKFTTASLVAQRIGFHICEVRYVCTSQKLNHSVHKVDCYELLDESNVNTEATLRVHFDQAVNASPCILILRHLEGLSQTTQGRDINESLLFFSSHIA